MIRNKSLNFKCWLLLFVCLVTLILITLIQLWDNRRRQSNVCNVVVANLHDSYAYSRIMTSPFKNHPPFVIKTRSGEGEGALELQDFDYKSNNNVTHLNGLDDGDDVIRDTRKHRRGRLVRVNGRLQFEAEGGGGRRRRTARQQRDDDLTSDVDE